MITIISMLSKFRVTRSFLSLGVYGYYSNNPIKLNNLPVITKLLSTSGSANNAGKDIKQDSILMYKALMEKVKAKNFQETVDMYEFFKQHPQHNERRVVEAVLSVCHKKEHLPFALSVFNYMIDKKIIPSEPVYLVLIRCYSDAGDIDKSLALIKQMLEINLEPKVRTYHPIIEAICKENDPNRALNLLHHMRFNGIPTNPEQILLLLEATVRTYKWTDKDYCQSLNELLEACSRELLGYTYSEMGPLVNLLTNDNSNGTSASRFHVLIDDRNVARPPPWMWNVTEEIWLETTSESRTLQVKTLNASLEDAHLALVSRNGDAVLQHYDSQQLLQSNMSRSSHALVEKFLKWVPETYTVVQPLPPLETKPDRFGGSRVKLVDVSNDSCRCPNCGDQLSLFLLSEEQRLGVRTSLMKIAAAKSLYAAKSLQAFGDWLKERPEFKYIVDGANVAYTRQNYDAGKFCYEQIDLIVKALQAENDGDVLVLLPFAYAQKVVPNSIKSNQRGVNYMSPGDLKLLEQLSKDEMLYTVPQGADDDWYWLYATVTEGRKEPAYVVTNDMIRDHRLAFTDEESYMRWKAAHMLHFDVFHPAEASSSSAGDETEDSGRRSIEPANGIAEAPFVYLIKPDNFSREMQRGPRRGYWHIPAVDRRVWLCLNTNQEE